ncbi:MAG TPA: hypothetical protein VD971_01345 [Phycisphaerales bacterium]|nr:hypothetical protein [Phycisphaerales bacterium]
MADSLATGGVGECWHHVLNAADDLLRQCEATVDEVPDTVYAAESVVMPGGTVGKHLRHLLDHYRALLCARDGGCVDYDRRERDVPMEVDRGHARRMLSKTRGDIAGLVQIKSDTPVRVRVMVKGDGTEAVLASTIGRELAFATHHAVHHQAMIKAIAGEFGVEMPGAVGKAPSTANHEARTADARGSER